MMIEVIYVILIMWRWVLLIIWNTSQCNSAQAKPMDKDNKVNKDDKDNKVDNDDEVDNDRNNDDKLEKDTKVDKNDELTVMKGQWRADREMN